MIEITDQDRAEFPHHSDGAIFGIKHLRSITTEDLKEALVNFWAFKRLWLELGEDTNRTWIKHRVADELYNRDEIDDWEYQKLQED